MIMDRKLRPPSSVSKLKLVRTNRTRSSINNTDKKRRQIELTHNRLIDSEVELPKTAVATHTFPNRKSEWNSQKQTHCRKIPANPYKNNTSIPLQLEF